MLNKDWRYLAILVVGMKSLVNKTDHIALRIESFQDFVIESVFKENKNGSTPSVVKILLVVIIKKGYWKYLSLRNFYLNRFDWGAI